ncbi:FCD domain-containing protein [Microvirga makkahensis]|uniref:FCD domain-containing protein n=1 Tax=Microvirga makkahensis TaxID=1128670 RepID=A0A7X3MW63_9HYPH|nr:FCD domain-containing protein [Microvirga makkahensis]MXQ14347.1 FCD domain-containing protein [Microvirga makkahensis]
MRTRSLTNVVQAEIERMIVSGELKPTQRINENALAQRLGVSRGPIREACSALAAMKLVDVIPNRGFFVRSLSEEEAAAVIDAHAGIFAYAGVSLAERITDNQIARLWDILELMEQAAETGDVTKYYPVNLEFHDAIVEMCGNQRIGEIYRALVRELHIHRYRGVSGGASALKISNAEHREIVEALAARDPMRTFAAMRHHIYQGRERNLVARRGEPHQKASVTS